MPGFVAALEKAVGQIERQPGLGSPRYALFHLDKVVHLQVVRLVHMSRDIPLSLWEPNDDESRQRR